MRKLLSILLLLAVLLQSFSKVIIYVNYEINRDYITRIYCVNKANPSKHCDGKCHLTKQMQEEEKQESIPGNTQKDKPEIQLFASDDAGFSLKLLTNQDITYPELQVSIPLSLAFPIFHPPTELS